MAQGKLVTPLWSLRALAVLSVAVPLILYAMLGSFRYGESHEGAEQRVSRSLRVAHEHAAKVLGGAESLQDRVFDAVNGKSPASLRAMDKPLHDMLLARMAGQKQIHSIWIVGADGKPIATSMAYPTPEVDLSDRPYFKHHKAHPSTGDGTRFLSPPFRSRLTDERILDLSMRFDGPDGEFAGTVNVSLLTKYFEQFYSDLVADEPGLAVNLFEADGSLYARWPTAKGEAYRMEDGGALPSRAQTGEPSAHMRAVSASGGDDRLMAYTRVGSYPLFVGTGMNLSELRRQFGRELAILLGLGLPPFGALFYASRVARKRTQDAIDAAHRLEAEIATRRRAEEALLQSQKLEALGRLTGGVAHDFNNALMVISNNAYLLQRNVTEAGKRQLQSIGRAVDSATKLTRQLLAFSRRQALLPETVSLQTRLPAAKELIAPVLGSLVELSIEVDSHTPSIHVDMAELELALLNLSINARDAMPSGGSFKIRARAARDKIPSKLGEGAVVIEAIDSGEGIDPKVIHKVFEPFFTTKPVGQGTGLGLSQIYGLCERAGGAASIESELGQGTAVRLFFPPATEAAGPRADERPPIERNFGCEVLVVEDNHDVAAALVPLLEALGCAPTRVESAAAALEWLESRSKLPDMVLSDVTMPGEMDGIGLALHLRRARPGLPLLLMTGYAERLDEIARHGFDVLPKPCSPEVLSAGIRRATKSSKFEPASG